MKKEKLFKRTIIVTLLTALLAASQTIPIFSNAAGVRVIEAESETEKAEKFISVTEETIVMRDDYGTFVVDHDVKQEKWRAAVFGDVKLILKDGCTWEIVEGIHLTPNSSLTVYGDFEETGKLYISNPRKHYAGIGGDEGQNAGNVTVYGGIVDVTGGLSAAGIGGGFEGNGGNVTVYGGTVIARSKSYGAGIGSGSAENKTGVHSGDITIYGGEVIATGGSVAAGIGGGWGASCDTVRITGGTVTAVGGEEVDGRGGAGIGTGANNKELPGVSAGRVIIEDGTVNATGTASAAGIGGGKCVGGAYVDIFDGNITAIGGAYAAGIGGGEDRDGNTVNIVGGTVRAQGGVYGAGIGGGEGGNQGGKVTISAGTVTATGGDKGAGIGGGQRYNGGGNGDEVEINGGSLTATGGIYAAGIGGGEDGNGGTMTVNTGTVVANGGEDAAGIGGGEDGDGISFTINGGEVTATGKSYGAGIGGGEDGNGGAIIINGGKVTAYAGDDGNSQGLGHGDGSHQGAAISLYDKARVYAGNNKGNPDPVLNENRLTEAGSKKYVIVDVCEHTPQQFTADDQGHQCTCIYCNESAKGVEPHVFGKDHLCTVCGYKAVTFKITFNNYDGTLLKEIEVEKNTLPVYDGATPQKPKEGGHAYRFVSWKPEIVQATKAATYTAEFEEVSDRNTVTWADYDDTVLETDTDVEYGAMPEYDGPTPAERKQGQYIYRFKGWEPEIAEVTGDITYKAVYEKIKYLFDVSFDMNGADSEAIKDQLLQAGETIKEPADPTKSAHTFAGWYLSDEFTSKWDFATQITGDVHLKAQWIEESQETRINDTDVMVTDEDLSGKENFSNLYNDLPLLVKTQNGYVYIPAHEQGPINIPDKRSPYAKTDILSSFTDPQTEDVYMIYLDLKDTDRIDETILKDIRGKGYREAAASGFEAVFYREVILGHTGKEKYEGLGKVTITISLKALGITLEDAPSDTTRTYYLAHNRDGEHIEYLPVSISSDKEWLTFVSENLSPFALVYKDTQNSQPSPRRTYVIPVTGVE